MLVIVVKISEMNVLIPSTRAWTSKDSLMIYNDTKDAGS